VWQISLGIISWEAGKNRLPIVISLYVKIFNKVLIILVFSKIIVNFDILKYSGLIFLH